MITKRRIMVGLKARTREHSPAKQMGTPLRFAPLSRKFHLLAQVGRVVAPRSPLGE
jgi:hypothetical protein